MIGGRGMPTTYGGIERAIEELSVRLAARGHNVTVYCRTAYCDGRPPQHRGVHLRYLPAVNTKHLEAITHTALATVDASFLRAFDVVHMHGTGPALLSPLARAARQHVVATVQGLDYRRDKWGAVARAVLRVGAWTAARAPHRTVVVSRELERYYVERYGVDARFVPNGVALPDHVPPSPPFALESGRYLLFLGRLVPEKDVHRLIDAYHDVPSDLPLVIAGPSSHSDDYVRTLQAAAERDHRVRLVGPVYGAEKEALLAHARAFCQPSRLEGLPIALLEALSYGRCAVASDLPEHREVLSDDAAAAFVFRSGDTVSLRDTLTRVISDESAVARAGARGRQIVAEHYDWNDIVDRLEVVYRELLAAARHVRQEVTA